MKLSKYILTTIVLTGSLYALPPGEGGDTNMYHAYIYGYVDDYLGNNFPNKGITADLSIWFYYGGPVEANKSGYKLTGSTGYAYQKVTISVPPAWGSPTGKYVSVTGPGQVCDETTPYNYYTNSSFVLHGYFDTLVDCDNNGWDDMQELALAEKFVPSYVPHHQFEFFHPEPIEFVASSNQKILAKFYKEHNGDYLFEAALYPSEASAYTFPAFNTVIPGLLPGDNYSSLNTAVGHSYTGFLAGSAGTIFGVVLAWDRDEQCNEPQCWYSDYYDEKINNYMRHTVYAHLFTSGGSTIVQYWVFFPYNDWVNDHEGDWEHVNVFLSSDDPATAQITKIQYYFHHKYISITSSQASYDGGTHPLVYIGGAGPVIHGNHSGGQFPWTGYWSNAANGLGESVSGNGPKAHYSAFIDGELYDNLGIVILPDVDDIDYDLRPEMSWFKAKLDWGNDTGTAYPPSRIAFISTGNKPPMGPAYRSGWNAIDGNKGGGPNGYTLWQE